MISTTATRPPSCTLLPVKFRAFAAHPDLDPSTNHESIVIVDENGGTSRIDLLWTIRGLRPLPGSIKDPIQLRVEVRQSSPKLLITSRKVTAEAGEVALMKWF